MEKEYFKDTVDGWYVSRLIDSLENDYERWEMKHCAGYDQSWTEYHSPEYKNGNGKRLRFADTLNWFGAYVDGTWSWDIPLKYRWNIFDSRMWRLRKAFREMKKYHIEKEKRKHLNKLVDSL